MSEEYPVSSYDRPLNEEEIKKMGNITGMRVIDTIREPFELSIADPNLRALHLNEDRSIIQNSENFPRHIRDHTTGLPFFHSNEKEREKFRGYRAAQYSFQHIPGDKNFPNMGLLEDQLMKTRAHLGIPVHGSRSVARDMKHYMYNRFKVPDINMVHNKSTTHIFFTRPDLNILLGTGNEIMAHPQTINHSEAAMVWRRNPDLFKLLVDGIRIGDGNNFNLLLSNQAASYESQDESLSYNEAGKTWNGYEMNYGDLYSGRTAGEFQITFEETDDYSVMNLIKLWITYIDLISRGAWLPNYSLRPTSLNSFQFMNSHVFTRTLDYAASMYVFKCDPTGDNILYWSKYYGIFPISTGASILSWQKGQPIGDGLRPTIRFRYSFKRDLSPINLIEFNANANVRRDGQNVSFIPSWEDNPNHSIRPFVGTPFVQMLWRNIRHLPLRETVSTGNESILRLKFQPISNQDASDAKLFRTSLSASNPEYKARRGVSSTIL